MVSRLTVAPSASTWLLPSADKRAAHCPALRHHAAQLCVPRLLFSCVCRQYDLFFVVVGLPGSSFVSPSLLRPCLFEFSTFGSSLSVFRPVLDAFLASIGLHVPVSLLFCGLAPYQITRQCEGF